MTEPPGPQAFLTLMGVLTLSARVGKAGSLALQYCWAVGKHARKASSVVM